MSTKPQALKVALLTLWSVGLTALTFILGGAALRALRVYAGEQVYWLVSLVTTGVLLFVGWEAYASVFLGSVLLIGVFSDMEERGYHYFFSGFIALLMVSLTGAGIFAFWISHQGAGWFEILVAQIEAPLLKVLPPDDSLTLQIGDIVRRAPSLILMLYVFSLYLALLFEGRILAALNRKPIIERRLLQFKVPDFLIWIFIGSLLGTFGEFKNFTLQTVAANVLHVSLLLYFLQGMAVISTFLKKLKMSTFWQTFLTVFLAVQLFAFVGVVGVMDYWIDFRKRMKPNAAELKKPFMRNK